MFGPTIQLNSGKTVSKQSVFLWRLAQILVWLIGFLLMISLLFFPSVGLLLFWNVLIPVAPALFVVALGVWRNVCPLALTNLLPRHFGYSRGIKMSPAQSGLFGLIAVFALFILVPLRHPVFNHNGVATALMIMVMVVIGMSLGFIYEWKSAWCSGLCPVHPVEKLYGGNVGLTVPNMNCHNCHNCVVPCPDSTPNMHPVISRNTRYHLVSGVLLAGGLPGFIWGWFQVPDTNKSYSFLELLGVYRLPLLGLLVSLVTFLLLRNVLMKKQERLLVAWFAALSVSCYYWYRIPALIGMGELGEDGVLYNLKGLMPEWGVMVIRVAVTSFFIYWLVYRPFNKQSWAVRPRFQQQR